MRLLSCVFVGDDRCCSLCCFAFSVRWYGRSHDFVMLSLPLRLPTHVHLHSKIVSPDSAPHSHFLASPSSTAEIIITASYMHAHHLQDVIGDRPASPLSTKNPTLRSSQPTRMKVGRLTMHAATSVTSTQPLHQVREHSLLRHGSFNYWASSIGMRRAEITARLSVRARRFLNECSLIMLSRLDGICGFLIYKSRGS
jgi:hypothetical protein